MWTIANHGCNTQGVNGLLTTNSLMQPTFSLHCMYTFGTLQVHFSLIWVSTALAMFACKRKPLTVCLYIMLKLYNSSALIMLSHNDPGALAPQIYTCYIAVLCHYLRQTGVVVEFSDSSALNFCPPRHCNNEQTCSLQLSDSVPMGIPVLAVHRTFARKELLNKEWICYTGKSLFLPFSYWVHNRPPPQKKHDGGYHFLRY